MPAHLFTRRRAVHDPAFWTPPGTTVVQRYRNALGPAEGAVVLVCSADDDPGPASYAAACLGCTYRDAEGHQRTARLSESDAAYLANTHAAGCRAISRGIPAAPDDTRAAAIVRARLHGLRPPTTGSVYYAGLSDFLADRVDLQRPAAFITHTMLHLARTEPDFLTVQPNADATAGPQFLLQPRPPRR
jgi:hypothetical protein